jgi:DNA-binding response OmpR family regulator
MDTSLRIALIDDNRAWRETVAEYLQAKGFAVSPADDGLRGLRLLEVEDIRLAVIDFHLGETDGLQLLRAVRHWRRPVVAFLTSSDEDPTLPARALAEGARAFLSKSLAPAAFLRTLLQSLRTAEPHFPLIIRRALWLPVVAPSRDPRRN